MTYTINGHDAAEADFLADEEREHELTPRERIECLVLAQMNDEKADLMRDDQPALKAFFMKNAQVLRHVAAK